MKKSLKKELAFIDIFCVATGAIVMAYAKKELFELEKAGKS